MDYTFLIDAISEELKREPSANLYKERGRLRMLNGDSVGAMHDLQEASRLDPHILDGIQGEFRN